MTSVSNTIASHRRKHGPSLLSKMDQLTGTAANNRPPRGPSARGLKLLSTQQYTRNKTPKAAHRDEVGARRAQAGSVRTG